ncbi:hypothetical protein ACFL6D_03215 [Spirochaetota bacterium]
MQQYYQLKLFNNENRFFKDDIERMLVRGRKEFFVFFPKFVEIEEIEKAGNYLATKSDIKICIHDLTLLNVENEIPLGRNLSFFYMLIEAGVIIESISYHFGSLFGFGARCHEIVIDFLNRLQLKKSQEKERYFSAMFDRATYREFIDSSLIYLFNINQIAQEHNIKMLVKNLSLEYIISTVKNEEIFTKKGYKLNKINDQLSIVPLLLEKGDFPRYAKEMLSIAEDYDVGISLDMEYLRYQVLLSRRYNVQNERMMRQWEMELSERDKKMLAHYGFTVQIGKPVFYEKPLDLYEQIFFLKDIVYIAHLSGSIGPVFLDKNSFELNEINDDMLLGILHDEDIPFSTIGKHQLSTFDGYDDDNFKRNFKYEASHKIWEKIFRRQFIEDIYLLKEIGCERIVQKMKKFSERAVETFNMFKSIINMDINPD